MSRSASLTDVSWPTNAMCSHYHWPAGRRWSTYMYVSGAKVASARHGAALVQALTIACTGGAKVRGVADGGGGGGIAGVTNPALLKTAGVDPPKSWIFQQLFSWKVQLFVFSNIFKIKWPKSEEKQKFWGRRVCVLMNPPPPQSKLCGDALGQSPTLSLLNCGHWGGQIFMLCFNLYCELYSVSRSTLALQAVYVSRRSCLFCPYLYVTVTFRLSIC